MSGENTVDSLEKIKSLNTRREDLLRRHAVLDSKRSDAVKRTEALEAEMRNLGTSPATIEADLENARKEVGETQIKYEKELGEYEKVIKQAEEALSEVNQ